MAPWRLFRSSISTLRFCRASISMISVVGKTREEWAQLFATRAMWNSFSRVIFSLVGVPLVGVFASVLGTKNQYAGVAFCLGPDHG